MHHGDKSDERIFFSSDWIDLIWEIYIDRIFDYECNQWNSISQLWGVTCHMRVTCHPTQVNTTRLNSSQIGWYSIYLLCRDRSLSRHRELITYRDGLPTHRIDVQSPIQVLTSSAWPGVKLATCWSQVRCPRYYTTKLRNHQRHQATKLCSQLIMFCKLNLNKNLQSIFLFTLTFCGSKNTHNVVIIITDHKFLGNVEF